MLDYISLTDVYWWTDDVIGVGGRRFDLPSILLSCNDSGQVVHSYAPLSPSSILWYWPKNGDAWLEKGKLPWVWRKVMPAYCRVYD